MFLNDLSSKTTQFSKVNTWLKKEFGIRIDERSSKEQLVNAKKMLVQHKRKLTENVQ